MNKIEFKDLPDTTTPINASNLNLLQENLVLQVYPVGSIYISVIDTDPGILFGGTWETFGIGKTLVGVDTNQTEFNIVEKTGGSKTHTHDIDLSGTHSYALNTAGLHYISASVSDGAASGDYTTKSGTTLQPYITVYMRKRTS